MADDRLYGVPGAEQMQQDLASAYENQVEPWVDEEDRRPRQIEEWTAGPIGNALPAADALIEWATESAWDDLPEEGGEQIENVGKDPLVVAAFDTALRITPW